MAKSDLRLKSEAMFSSITTGNDQLGAFCGTADMILARHLATAATEILDLIRKLRINTVSPN